MTSTRTDTHSTQFANRARAVGITADRWPYGPNIDHHARAALVNWAETHKLRHSPHGNCIRWLTHNRCATTLCVGEDHHGGAWFDHVTGWCHAGKPAVLVAQPYHLSNDAHHQLTALRDRHDLHLEIHRAGGWYGHRTVWIALWRQAPRPEES